MVIFSVSVGFELEIALGEGVVWMEGFYIL